MFLKNVPEISYLTQKGIFVGGLAAQEVFALGLYPERGGGGVCPGLFVLIPISILNYLNKFG